MVGRPPVLGLRRREYITALFTPDEKSLVFREAASRKLTVSIFVHEVVMEYIEDKSSQQSA